MRAATYVVTVNSGGTSQSQTWNSSTPIGLGYPFRWVLEKAPDGVLLRELSPRLGAVEAAQVHRFTDEMIHEGKAIDIASQTSISIHRTAPIHAAYAQPQSPTGTMRIFCCNRNWILDSSPLDSSTTGKKPFSARIQKKIFFTISPTNGSWLLEAKVPNLGIQLQDGQPSQPLQSMTLSSQELAAAVISAEPFSWHFLQVETPTTPESILKGKLTTDQDMIWFKKSLRNSLVALAAFSLLSLLWPTPKRTDLIPAQYAKIIMTQAPKPAEPAQPSAGGGGKSEAGTKSERKVERTAVVQAFRAKALRNAVSGLLKGGMTSLLSQSQFMVGPDATSGARRIFNTKDSALQPTGAEIGMSNSRQVNVASLGGEGGAGGTGGGVGGGRGKGVGYGSGEHAGVKGQGTSMVSTDAPDASVQEGLTKDEVGEVIHRHLSEVRYCYESAMLSTPDLEGKLLVNFTIAKTGRVSTAAVKSSTLSDPRLDDCIVRRLMTWKFPATKGGIDVAVTYPFIFKTLGR